MRPSARLLIDLLDAFARAYDLDASMVDIIGFSQGAAMTFTLGWLYPQRVRKMGILAGFAPEGAEEALQPGVLRGRHVFVAHGTHDQIVPVAQARRVIQLLQSAGAEVSYCESEVGHKLSADCLGALEMYLHS
jgi:phospholipase/carboxylesterase